MAASSSKSCGDAGKPSSGRSASVDFQELVRRCEALDILHNFDPGIDAELARIDAAKKTSSWKLNGRDKLRRKIERQISLASAPVTAPAARASASTTHPADAAPADADAVEPATAAGAAAVAGLDAAAAALANAEPATELATGPDAAAAAPADAGLAAAAEPMDTGPSQPLPTVGAWARIAGLAARPTLNGTLPRPPSSARCPRTAVMLCTGCGVSFGYG